MIDDVDADGSGSINFPEFIELMLKKQQGGLTKEDIKQVCIHQLIITSKLKLA